MAHCSVVQPPKPIRFTESDLTYLRELMPHAEDGFFDMLRALDCSEVRMYAMKEGSVSDEDLQ